MTPYIIYRIIESNGFVAKRAILYAQIMSQVIYGQCMIEGRRVLIPEMYLKDN